MARTPAAQCSAAVGATGYRVETRLLLPEQECKFFFVFIFYWKFISEIFFSICCFSF